MSEPVDRTGAFRYRVGSISNIAKKVYPTIRRDASGFHSFFRIVCEHASLGGRCEIGRKENAPPERGARSMGSTANP